MCRQRLGMETQPTIMCFSDGEKTSPPPAFNPGYRLGLHGSGDYVSVGSLSETFFCKPNILHKTIDFRCTGNRPVVHKPDG